MSVGVGIGIGKLLISRELHPILQLVTLTVDS